MLSFIQGRLMASSPTRVLIDTGHFGFEVQITLSTFEFLKGQDSCKLYTYLHIKKDGQMFSGYEMYGFIREDDRFLFELLLGVSGIGANTARLVLNALSDAELKRAIMTEDEHTISSVKGIGPKTAKRLILELKDKISKGSDHVFEGSPIQNNMKDEALLALITLGYQKNNVLRVLNTIESKSKADSVEQFIKLALKSL